MGSLNKPHAVLVPYPAQGHINPLMQLAKLLLSRGFYISFVNTEFNHKRLLRSKGLGFTKGLTDFQLETIPDGLPPSDSDSTQNIWALSDSVQKNCLGPFRELLAKLNASPESPPVSCVISDGCMSFTIEAAKELGVPEAQFWTTSACGFMAYLHFSQLIKRGVVPFKDEEFIRDGTLETPINGIPGMRNMQLKDFPTLIRTTDRDDIMLNFMKNEAHNCFKSSAIILNTFDELENEVLEALAARCPNIYSIGPLSLIEKQLLLGQAKSLRSSLWKEDSKCLGWLDNKEPDSVLLVSYGSITVMSEQQFTEFAWGLAGGKHPFLWVVRPDVVMGGHSGVLPEEYFDEIEDRGLIVSWCPQDQVLSHPSVGAFLTHCGWNSTLESICGGKPVICWPVFDEQPTNCLYSCIEWGIGMAIDHKVKRNQVQSLVKEMMEGEKGKQMKKKALEWKKKAEKATNIGGSSYSNFNRFIREIL